MNIEIYSDSSPDTFMNTNSDFYPFKTESDNKI